MFLPPSTFCFTVHQNLRVESPLLQSSFIRFQYCTEKENRTPLYSHLQLKSTRKAFTTLASLSESYIKGRQVGTPALLLHKTEFGTPIKSLLGKKKKSTIHSTGHAFRKWHPYDLSSFFFQMDICYCFLSLIAQLHY